MKHLGKVLVPLTAISLLAGCGNHQPPNHSPGDDAGIVNGESVKPSNELGKSVVALILEQRQGKALCTGTILSDDTVLTAAHCVQDVVKLAVIFAPTIEDVKEADERVTTIFKQNPGYEKSMHEKGDLALIHFEGGLPAGYSAVTLADKTAEPKAGMDVTMLGFGVDQALEHEGAGSLRETQTKIIGTDGEDDMASDGSHSSACFGDSGGPAFVKDGSKMVQLGVASAVTNAECNGRILHTNIIGYRAWIAKTMTDLRKKTGSKSKK